MANTTRLQLALNHALRKICRAFSTTSIPALQYISHIPPISHTIERLCYSSSIRLHRLLAQSPTLQRIPSPLHSFRLTHRNSNRSYPISTPLSRQSPLQRIAKLTNATPDPQLNPIRDPPWEETFHDHPRVNTILPPPKDQRDQYSATITQLLTSLPHSPDTLVIGTDGSRRRVNTNQPNNPNTLPRPRNRHALLSRRRIHGRKRTGAGIHARLGHDTIFERSYGIGTRTNVYDGESFGLAAGMRLALQYCKENRNVTKILFLSDSSSALSNITNSNAHPSQSLSLLFIKYAREFLINDTHQITLQWIPGHQGHEINERADRLARRGCQLPQELAPETLSYHAEKRSKLILRRWRHQTKEKPFSGPFGEITSYPPTTKPNQVFTQLRDNPEVFGRLTQIRTMHGYNPSYFARFNIPHEPECICGDRIPTIPISHYRDHVLHNCESYDNHRHILTAVHRDHSPAILLGGPKGQLAVAKFLALSGAFTASGRPYEPPKPPDLPGLDLSDPVEPSEPI
jgi:ribonuclease HI